FHSHQLEKNYHFEAIPSPFYAKYQKALASVAATLLLFGLSACTVNTVTGEPIQQEYVSEHSKKEENILDEREVPVPIVKGKVWDKKTGEPLANVTVNCKAYQLQTKTDANGYFQLTLPKNVGRQIMLEIKDNAQTHEVTFHAVQKEDFSTLQSISLTAKSCVKPSNLNPGGKGEVIMGKPAIPQKTMGVVKPPPKK
ncbi:MAG: carboxypeptidase-like regulatory domain-containing protein, partial [Bacteroidia bacterium]